MKRYTTKQQLMQDVLTLVENGRLLDMRYYVDNEFACGTTYCIAGAICQLVDGAESLALKSMLDLIHNPIDRAIKILATFGITPQIAPAEHYHGNTIVFGAEPYLTTSIFTATEARALEWLHEHSK